MQQSWGLGFALSNSTSTSMSNLPRKNHFGNLPQCHVSVPRMEKDFILLTPLNGKIILDLGPFSSEILHCVKRFTLNGTENENLRRNIDSFTTYATTDCTRRINTWEIILMFRLILIFMDKISRLLCAEMKELWLRINLTPKSLKSINR